MENLLKFIAQLFESAKRRSYVKLYKKPILKMISKKWIIFDLTKNRHFKLQFLWHINITFICTPFYMSSHKFPKDWKSYQSCKWNVYQNSMPPESFDTEFSSFLFWYWSFSSTITTRIKIRPFRMVTNVQKTDLKSRIKVLLHKIFVKLLRPT